MSARFTVTEKWKDPWFRQQTPNAKCLWEYMRDNCDIAGILEWDNDAACFHTGLKQKDLEAALKGLERGYIAASGHIMLRTFLKHQRNMPLNENNPAHRGVIKRITEASEIFPNALDELNKRGVLNIQEGACKGLLSSIGICNGKGVGKGNGTGKGKTGFKSWALEDFEASCTNANHDAVLSPEEEVKFHRYWTEPDSRGNPRYAKQTTWDTRRRMQTWRDNIKERNKPRDWRGDMSMVPKLAGDMKGGAR